MTQRNKRCRNLYLHLVAHSQLVRARHRNHKVAQLRLCSPRIHRPTKVIRINVAHSSLAGGRIFLAIVDKRRQVAYLHVVAQLVVKGNVARGRLGTIGGSSGITCTFRNLFGNVREDLRQLSGTRRALIEGGVFTIAALSTITKGPGVFRTAR